MLDSRGKSKLKGDMKGALQSVVTNRQWTQQRKHKAGLVEVSNCQLCEALGLCSRGDVSEQFCGTLLHRCITCPALEEFRSKRMPGSVCKTVEEWKNTTSSNMRARLGLWLTRAIREDPFVKLQLSRQEESWLWDVFPEGGLVTGTI